MITLMFSYFKFVYFVDINKKIISVRVNIYRVCSKILVCKKPESSN
jgi:hypothetical protein